MLLEEVETSGTPTVNFSPSPLSLLNVIENSGLKLPPPYLAGEGAKKLRSHFETAFLHF